MTKIVLKNSQYPQNLKTEAQNFTTSRSFIALSVLKISRELIKQFTSNDVQKRKKKITIIEGNNRITKGSFVGSGIP